MKTRFDRHVLGRVAQRAALFCAVFVALVGFGGGARADAPREHGGAGEHEPNAAAGHHAEGHEGHHLMPLTDGTCVAPPTCLTAASCFNPPSCVVTDEKGTPILVPNDKQRGLVQRDDKGAVIRDEATGNAVFVPAPEDNHWWLGLELPKAFREKLANVLGASWIDHDKPSMLNVGHLFFGLLAFLIGLGLALAARRAVKDQVVPPAKWSAAAFFDVLVEAILGLMTSMMPRHKAVRFLPLVAAAATFILISNLLGMVPGFVPPTQSLNTTLVLGIVAFLYYNYQGFRTHGVLKYLKHFMGPMLVLAPLMIVIELISHCVRPLSLGLRLMGNMFGDHQVLFIFMGFGLPLIPLPLMALGLLVCIVQTVVFTLLFVVYLSLAVEEHEHEGHEKHGGHGHDGAHAGHGHAAQGAPAH